MKKPPSSLVALCLFLLSSCEPQAATRVYFPGTNPDLPYSSAVRVGNTVYISGHLGVDPKISSSRAHSRGTSPSPNSRAASAGKAERIRDSINFRLGHLGIQAVLHPGSHMHVERDLRILA